MTRRTGCLILLLVVCLAYMAYTLWLRQGRSLDPQLIPTAAFLAQDPLPLPAYIAYIDPEPSKTLTAGQEMCLLVHPAEFIKLGEIINEDLEISIARNTSFTINHRPISSNFGFPGGVYKVVEGQEVGDILFCLTLDLEPGIHLAEMQIKDLSGKTYSYSWSFPVQ
jgi:hypothetical protein